MNEIVPKINLNKGDKFNRTPISLAARNGHPEVIAYLLKHNADPELPDTSGNSPLHYAAAYGWTSCLKVLLRLGRVSAAPENSWKTTPVTVAMQKNHSAVLKELLATGEVNVNAKDDEGRSLLSLTMANVNLESASLVSDLLKQKKQTDVNAQDTKGRTALYHLVEAMSQRRRKAGLFGLNEIEEVELKVAFMLLEAGADAHIKAKDGKSPMTIAFENGIQALLDLFGEVIDLNQDPNLFFAVTDRIMQESTQEMMRQYIEGDGRRTEDETINFVNDEGFTPFLAYLRKFLEMKPGILNVVQHLISKKPIGMIGQKNSHEDITNELILDTLISKPETA